jgi:hypothetical protein
MVQMVSQVTGHGSRHSTPELQRYREASEAFPLIQKGREEDRIDRKGWVIGKSFLDVIIRQGHSYQAMCGKKLEPPIFETGETLGEQTSDSPPAASTSDSRIDVTLS